MLLKVCYMSSPEAEQHRSVTSEIIRELREKSKDRRETEEKPILTVLNKCDLVEDCPVPVNEKVAVISAAAGTGLEELLHKIAALLEKTQTRLWLEIPFEKGHLLGLIRQEGRIFSEEYTEKGTRVDALVDRRALPQVEQFRVE